MGRPHAFPAKRFAVATASAPAKAIKIHKMKPLLGFLDRICGDFVAFSLRVMSKIESTPAAMAPT